MVPFYETGVRFCAGKKPGLIGEHVGKTCTITHADSETLKKRGEPQEPGHFSPDFHVFLSISAVLWELLLWGKIMDALAAAPRLL